ncbi:hypothetical protein CBR_g45542 [Chara braunii]|uniref:Uncharacterized protein n=1 Tax=Chara braunii TaxID=69332 RepID=A0A388LZ03_CHABU|nr:hypothetical protein CBR_g45542 [Chara braunii]|eukprot:GBG87483.1 hypothetical protein CBR_g45542 [Chara braunii]
MDLPSLVAPTLEDITGWLQQQNEEAQLAYEEHELEEKWNEIRRSNEDLIPIGQRPADGTHDDYEQDVEDEDADNVEDESETDEFEQEPV